MDERAAGYVGRIAAMAPGVVVEQAVFNGDGAVNDVVIVNDRLVFRFAKSAYGVKALAGELKVMAAIRGRVGLEIPEPFYTSAEAIAYPLVPGETFSREAALSLPEAAQQAAADQLGGFLRALHTTPDDGELPATLAPVRREQWLGLREKIEAAVYPLLLPHQVAWARGLFEQALGDPAFFEHPPRLIHGDLGPYHILFDRTAQRLHGIIDFGVAGMGDPAGDLGAMLQIYGESFTHRLLRAYPEAEALLPRARFYAQSIELQWAMLGLTGGEKYWFTAHLGGARDIFM